MSFNSLAFLIFYPFVTILYFLFPLNLRLIFLLLTSYYFYMSWNPKYIILIVISTVVTYLFGLIMGKTEKLKNRKMQLVLCLLINLGILFVFKYFNFFNGEMSRWFSQFNVSWGIPNFEILLPVGISFYTFQALSYSIDVYRGNKKPEKNLLVYALYVSFFPQLVAGPIERSTRLLPQFYKKHDFNYDRVTDGVKLMLWGYFKKIVIADRLAIFVNNVYNNPHDLGSIPLIVATVFFGIQIYCDFSGYSDIAIGSAQVMGFNLMDNFKRPYFSKTITEFWRRWHISLSTWFKDYLYIPLGGNRCSMLRNYFNIMVTFLISGIWHGANWTFIVWGALHGFYVVMEHVIKGAWEKSLATVKFPLPAGVKKYIQILFTFTLVTFAWIFFRANSISDAFYIVGHLFTDLGSLLSYGAIKADLLGKGLGFGEYDLIIAIVSIAFMEYVHIIQRHESIRHMLRDKPIYIRWSIYYALVMWILLFGEYGTNKFIYYQF